MSAMCNKFELYNLCLTILLSVRVFVCVCTLVYDCVKVILSVCLNVNKERCL